MRRPASKQKDNLEKPEGFLHKKSLGQNFLTSATVPRWMCDAAAVAVGDTVLEIGPGTGALTRELLTRGAHVIALEADSRAITILEETFALELQTGQLVLKHGDARDISVADLNIPTRDYKVVANIPYYLSGYLLRTILESANPPRILVFLMQKEVVTRIARDKKASLLSLSVQVFGQPKYVKTVSRGHFKPAPNVDSAILLVSNIKNDHFSGPSDREGFFNLLHLGFGQKRKQLIHNLGETYSRPAVEAALATLGLSPQVRAEDIPVTTWLQLYRTLTPSKE
jgi:16S rRNA (adenine1518-N6/adenine1519-N6)-dimethyltransferase